MATQNFKIGLSNEDKATMRDDIAQDTLEKVVNGQVQIGDETTNLEEKIAEINRAAASVDNKAEIDGYYEGMGVGEADTAKQLMSTIHNEDSTPFIFRTSGGSKSIGDRVQIEYIEGGTWKWNQLADERQAINTTIGGIVITYDANSHLFTFNGTATEHTYNSIINQQFDLKANHRYLMVSTNDRIAYYKTSGGGDYFEMYANHLFTPTADCTARITYRVASGYVANNEKASFPRFIDLADIFGAGNEPTDVNSPAVQAVIEYAKEHPEYDEGSLKSVSVKGKKYVGFNQWDEQWEVGDYNLLTGAKLSANDRIRTKDFIEVVGDQEYYFRGSVPNQFRVLEYDKDKKLIKFSSVLITNATIVLHQDTRYLTFCTNPSYGTTYKNDICINLSWNGSLNGQYLPHETKSYVIGNPMTGTELRGIVKNVDGSLQYDGDRYYPDGKVERRFVKVDLSTLNWITTTHCKYADLIGIRRTRGDDIVPDWAISDKYSIDTANKVFQGLSSPNSFAIGSAARVYVNGDVPSGYLVCELETPTEETSVRYQELQDIDDWGTEEFIGSEIPVGHKSNYFPNLRDKVQNLPNNASQDGLYIVKQEGGQQSLAPTSEITAPLVAQENALKEALGGTLRQLLAQKANIDFDRTAWVDLGQYNWTYARIAGGAYGFLATLNGLKYQTNPAINAHILTSKYQTVTGNQAYDGSKIGISTLTDSERITIYDTNAGTDPIAFKNSLKGVLLAYEKGE